MGATVSAQDLPKVLRLRDFGFVLNVTERRNGSFYVVVAGRTN